MATAPPSELALLRIHYLGPRSLGILSERSGLSRTRLSRMERGEAAVGPETLVRYAEGLVAGSERPVPWRQVRSRYWRVRLAYCEAQRREARRHAFEDE